MFISTKGRYALRLVIDIAQNQQNGPVSLREVAKRSGISVKYLEQLAGQLGRVGVLTSTRGAHGGYKLARAAEDISAGDVLRASEGSTAPVACLEDDFGVCPRRGICETIDFWEGLDKVIVDYLDSRSLASMVPPQTEGSEPEVADAF